MLSPENGSFASVAPWEIERLPGALTPALRRRDHTLLPYAIRAFVKCAHHVHRIPAPRFDDRERPSEWDGMQKDVPVIWVSGKEKFCPSCQFVAPAGSVVIACDKRKAFAQGSESDEAIHVSLRKHGLLRFARNDGRYSSAISRQDMPELCQKLHALPIQRAQGMPDARCTRGLMCDVH